MKFIKVLLLCILFYMGSTVQSFAQVKTIPPSDTMTTSSFVAKNLYKLNFIMPGLGYEHRLANRFTIGLSAYFNPWGGWGVESFSKIKHRWHEIGVRLRIKLQGRYYYNFPERRALGRNTGNNAANYFGLQLKYDPFYWFHSTRTERTLTKNAGTYTCITWGMQRSYGHLYINLELGAGLELSAQPIDVWPHLNFTFGYLLFKGINDK